MKSTIYMHVFLSSVLVANITTIPVYANNEQTIDEQMTPIDTEMKSVEQVNEEQQEELLMEDPVQLLFTDTPIAADEERAEGDELIVKAPPKRVKPTKQTGILGASVVEEKQQLVAAVGDYGQTIGELFTDPIFAQKLVELLGVTDVNVVLTQTLADSLTQINLLNEGISNIENIHLFKKLSSIELSQNKISVIPNEIGQLTNLQYFNIAENNISVIPNSIGSLSKLIRFHIYDNNISVVPEQIGQITTLKNLHLKGNHLTELPQSIGNLVNLEYLYLQNNNLTTLPEGIGNFSKLIQLRASENKLSSIPDSIGNLKAIKQLHLQENELTQIPSSMGQLVNLDILYLHGNFIKQIPNSIGDLKNLTTFHINNNELVELPSTLGNLTKLTRLDIHFNRLTKLPDTIANLTRLATFYINNNQLTSLPTGIQNLPVTAFNASYNLLKTEETIRFTTTSFPVGTQDQLQWNTPKPTQEVQQLVELLTVEELQQLVIVERDGRQLPTYPLHTFMLVGYFDASGKLVNLDEYFQDGNVIKEGTLTVKVRATGEGLFPNTSDSAITLDAYTYILTILDDTEEQPGEETGVEGEEGNGGIDDKGNEVSNDTAIQDQNGFSSSLPQTNNAATQLYQVIGMIFLLISSLYLFVRRRKEHSHE